MSHDVFAPFNIQETIKEIITEYEMKQHYPGESVGTLYLVSDPGMGKTAAVHQAAKELSKKYNEPVPVIVFIASQADPTDARGLPFKFEDKEGNVTTRYLPPHEIANLIRENERGIVFCDEVADAAPLMKASMSQWMSEHKIGDIELPIGWTIIGAGNFSGSGASAGGFPTQFWNRLHVMEVKNPFDTGDGQGWLHNYAIPHNISPYVLKFLESEPDFLHKYDPAKLKKEKIGAFPSHRAWTYVSNYLQSPHDKKQELRRVAGMVGQEAALKMKVFLETADLWEGLDPDDCIKRPKQAAIPKPHQMGIVYMLCAALVSRATPETLPNLIEYVIRLPGEQQWMIMSGVSKKDGKLITKDFKKWALNHGADIAGLSGL